MISVLDYGMGNIGSLVNMFSYLGIKNNVVSEPKDLRRADKLVLPGVGAFDRAMRNLNAVPGLREALDERVLSQGVPTLGICLGMQLLMDSSDEGNELGLKWIPGRVKRFVATTKVKVPHMGWNTVERCREHPLTANLGSVPKFYFVHSFFVLVADPADSIMRSTHGGVFDSAIASNNVMGVQFHPEKSHQQGMKLLANFASI